MLLTILMWVNIIEKYQNLVSTKKFEKAEQILKKVFCQQK